ncbi:MAG: hypothetical protein WBB69_11910 [Anaerolineales bacterium]
MVRKNPPLILILATLLFILTGCNPDTYNHSALCEDREVLFCEDFESEPFYVGYVAYQNLPWWVTDDGYLGNYTAEGRSQGFLATCGKHVFFYDDDTANLLHTFEIDLSGAGSATLYYNLLYATETHWDGMIVVATTDWGSDWVILEPQGGYPDTILLDGQIIPGYSGHNTYWVHEQVDLSPVLGSDHLILGFYFASDWAINYRGVVLDDIVVDGDFTERSTWSQLTDDLLDEFPVLPEMNLILPKDPLITTEIPRATAFMDTPCEGEVTEILKESQRAFVKAVNETGDRYSVLHPESGNFCWVSSEDVWIDGHDWDLPQLSDKKPEDLYLPVCGLRRTPIISDPACQTSGETSLPYQVKSALVENGKITTLVLDPGTSSSGGDLQEILDPRISGIDQLPEISVDPGDGPGGIINLSLNGAQYACSLDKGQAGRIICDGLSLDAGGPLQISLCWQGWDKNTLCPPGFAADPGREKCQPLADLGACAQECPDGYSYSTGEGLCLVEITEEGKDTEFCPEGFSVNPDAECCVSSMTEDRGDCPAGYYYGLEGSACQPFPEDGTCPDGFIFQEEPATCIPETGSSAPVCAAIDIQLPNPEVTVKESAHCWRGPGSSYENVSSLKPFTIVEVLGIGEGGEYLVINNPKYQIPCWVKNENLYLDKLDMTILPFIPVLPTEGGTGSSTGTNPTGQQGCLVAEDMSSAPKCVVPCPDPVKYPSPCTP